MPVTTPYVPHVFGDAVAEKIREHPGWFCASVASSIPWPAKDVCVTYAGDDFILLGAQEGDRRMAPAIAVPGVQQQRERSLAKLYRFTSILGWFLGGFVDAVDVVHSARPIRWGLESRFAHSAVGQAGEKSFECNYMPVIDEENIRIALAFWREGERLTHVHDSYAFLSYFKVIESQFTAGRDRAAWIALNLDHIDHDRAAARIAELRAAGGNASAHLYDSGRNAVAHASLDGEIVDPDIPADRRRIASDLVVIRELARRCIAHMLGVPTALELYGTRNRLEPCEHLIDPAALQTLKQGGTPAPHLLNLDGLMTGLRIWPDEAIPDFEAMTLRVDAVHNGAARVLLFNARMTVMFAFVMDFRAGKIHTQLDNSALINNPEQPATEHDVRNYYTVFRRVLGNAVVELLIDGCEPVDCEVVVPVNILLRPLDETVDAAVEAFRRQRAEAPDRV